MNKYNKKGKNGGNSIIRFLSILLCIFGLSTLAVSCMDETIDNLISSEEEKEEENSSIDEPNDEIEKQLYCQYDSSINYESSQGGLRIYIPSNEGYINWNFIHSFSNGANCNMWRLSKVFSYDDNFENEEALTSSAEWEMALTLSGRDDFIGGNAHGDEKFTSLYLYINGINKDITSFEKLTPFEELKIVENSIGYDPNDHTTEVLKHYKEYIINENGIVLNQKVEWLGDYELSSCYMAMMPPLKTLTDTYYTNINYTPTDIVNWTKVQGCIKATLYGKSSNISYTMEVPKYKTYDDGNHLLITDNGGGAYNKMYFVICNSANVSSGEIWETTTHYNIING